MFLSSCQASEITGFAVSCDVYLQILPLSKHASSFLRLKKSCLYWETIKSNSCKPRESQNTWYDSTKAESQVVIALWITNTHHAALWNPLNPPTPESATCGSFQCFTVVNWSLRKCAYIYIYMGLFFLILYIWDIFIHSMYSILALSVFIVYWTLFQSSYIKLHSMFGSLALFCE